MKKRKAILTLASLALAFSASAYTHNFIGAGASNGDFQTLDPFEGWNGATPLTVTSNATRRLVSNSTIGAYLTFPGWTATRTYYSGGNGAWGLDAGNQGLPPAPNVDYFMNSGDATLVSATYDGGMRSGDVVTVSFDLSASTVMAVEPASCAGQIDLGGGQVFSWDASAASVAAVATPISFTTNFTLTASAYEATLTLFFSSGRNTGGTSSANQTVLDNVVLTATGDGPAPQLPVKLVGADLRNGDFQSNDVFTAWTNLAMTNALPMVSPPAEGVSTNANGRRMVYSSVIGRVATWPGWTARRTYYNGGNPAWGLDNGKYEIPGSPNVAWFVNSGDFDMQSGTISEDMYAGDELEISFELQAGDIYTTNSGGVAAYCAGSLDIGDGEDYSWTATEGSVVTNQQKFIFSKKFSLLNDATNVVINLEFSTGRGQNGDANRSANQCHMDNVTLRLFAGVGGGEVRIIDITPVAGDMARIELQTSSRALTYPVAKGDLVNDPSWSRVPHSDDGVNAMVETNLLYSTSSGTNRVIYVETVDSVKFYGIGND